MVLIRRSRAPAAALALALLPGCAGVSFGHVRAGVEPDLRAARRLEPGEATLEDCLRALGAPNAVERDEHAGGRVLTWRWEHVHGWGFFASLPLSDLISASLNFSREGRDPDRLRLVFDDGWVLRERVED